MQGALSLIVPPHGAAHPAAHPPPAPSISSPPIGPFPCHVGVTDVRFQQPDEDGNVATSVTHPPQTAVVPNDAGTVGRGEVDKDAKPGATKKSASPISPPAACHRCRAVDVLAEIEYKAHIRTPTAPTALDGLGGIGVRAESDAVSITATAIPSFLNTCRTMDVVA